MAECKAAVFNRKNQVGVGGRRTAERTGEEYDTIFCDELDI